MTSATGIISPIRYFTVATDKMFGILLVVVYGLGICDIA